MRTDPRVEESPKVEKYNFDNFQGGLRRNVDPSKIGDSEYPFLVNGRTRYGSVVPINAPKEIACPVGNLQSCYASEGIVLLFVSGNAFYMDINAGETFLSINTLQLDADVDKIYAELVPDSFFNLKRSTTGDAEVASAPITKQNPDNIEISKSAVIAQDGINRPWLIRDGFIAKEALDFDDWTLENREYVPIGKNMLYHNGKLYIVSPDNKRIYHSVTGRPLDFVIAVNNNGEKITGCDPEANRLAHAVSYHDITALFFLNTDQEHPDLEAPFMVHTNVGTTKVTPLQSNTLFGEPTFRNTDLFRSGARNQDSIILARKKFHFIDGNSIRVYDTVGGMEVSKDDALSGTVYELLDSVSQSVTAAAFLDNYSLFSMNTIYGPAVLVYDNLLEKFVSLDIFDGVAQIKQFCQTNVDGNIRLFFITTDNKFYEYYGSTSVATCGFYFKECTVPDAEVHHKIMRLRLTFKNVEETGTVFATPVTDGFLGNRQSKSVPANYTKSLPLTYPMGDSSQEHIRNVTFAQKETKQAERISYYIEFGFKAELTGIFMITKRIDAVVAPEQRGQIYS
jgi:hypothetical protein